MTHQSFPPPPINPFERLHVYDGLMMNSKRWLLAHEYHRRRQNVHYQSLNQPGIVWGLGVRLIDPPAEAAAQFRDGRWVEIQPGIAIDVEGNPIVVDAAIDRKFRIATAAPLTGSLTVYLVVSYVDPYNPDRQQNSELLREWIRFDERTTPPEDHQVELCRIQLQLQPGIVKLEKPSDVLFPEPNQLDLRYRMQAKARPQAVVKVAQMKQNEADYDNARKKLSNKIEENISYLMKSVAALYPSLQGETEIGKVSLQTPRSVAAYDLLYLADSQVVEFEEEEIETLRSYLRTGGIVLIDSPSYNEDYADIIIDDIIKGELEIELKPWQKLERENPLRSQPFLFAGLPNINQQQIELWSGDGVILVRGALSSAWGLDEEYLRDRNEIRTAQELGINILHLAWRRRQITQLMQ
ncbi:MAG TPA: hypothetical protein DCY88_34755 [Cyanobacteria bacterium UBA11372]|nr:hypothetical protein [Cyanobacteria bacterium UBA11372]